MTTIDHFHLSAILTSVLNVLLVLFVLRFARNRGLRTRFVWYGCAISWWAFFLLPFSRVDDPNLSYLFCQLLHGSSIFIPPLFIHFLFCYLHINEKREWSILKIIYVISGVFWFFDILQPKYFILSVTHKLGFPYFMNPGPLYLFWMLTFFGIIIYGHIILLKGIIDSRGMIRNQRTLFFIGNALGYFGGIGTFLPVYDKTCFPYPYGVYGVALFSVVTAYASMRFKFIDIEVIIKKTLVFAGVFGMMMSVVAGVTSLMQSYVSQFFKVDTRLSMSLSVAAAILLYDPVRKFLVEVTDRYLFQKKDDIKVILNQLAGNIIMILDISQVADKILATLREELRLESGAIIIKDEKDKGYEVLESFNIAAAGGRYDGGDIFLKYLGETKRIINLENAEEKNTLPAPILGRLQDFRAVLCIPLLIHNELIGVLTLGKKKSDEEYTSEELDYLPTVASQVSIALSNARLYEILKKSQVDFAQQAKMAAIGTLSAGISHEIKNPLNHMRLAVGMLRLNKRLGVYNNFTKDQFEGEVFNAVERIDVNITRATEVIERLSSFAKKPKELKLEPVSLEKALEKAFRLLDRELEHYGIAVQKNYTADLPLVSADEHAVEDVFLNLLVNARHAIKEKGTITVGTCLRGRAVEVAIRDTGCGISPENLEKIFDPFFTTKDTTRNPDGESVKGTGLGLFIVRELIKKLGGRIDVESEVGKGTCFRITFPVLQEELAKGA